MNSGPYRILLGLDLTVAASERLEMGDSIAALLGASSFHGPGTG